MTKFNTQDDVRDYMRDNAGFAVISGVMKTPEFIKHFQDTTGHVMPRDPKGIELLVDEATGYDYNAEMFKYVLALFNFVYETEWAELSADDRAKLNIVGLAMRG